jgi:ATP-dependent DNA ligase
MAEIFQLCEVLSEKDFLNSMEDYYNKSDYTANIKFDGERIMAKCEGGEVILINRNLRGCNANFPEIVAELLKLKGDFILDGEIISIDDDFNKLQRRALTKNKEKQEALIKEVPVKFVIFDILKYNGKDISGENLSKRIEYMNKFKGLLDEKLIEVAEFLPCKEMYNKARAENREGIIIKKTDYEYRRCRGIWRKVKFFEEGELEAISYTENPKGIRVEDKDKNSCQIAGRKNSKEVKNLIDKNGKARIVIQYLEKTADNKYRFPSFRGYKIDNDDKVINNGDNSWE